MGITRTELDLAKEVAAITEDYVEFTPALGEFQIMFMRGEAAFDANVAIKLIWDYGGTEEILWITKGSGYRDKLIRRTGDGVKKLAIALENGLASPVLLEGYAYVEQG